MIDLMNSSSSYDTAEVPVIRTREDFEAMKRQAMNGDSQSQCAVADIYADHTRGEFFDVFKAADWYEMAAEQGHTRAQWLLGVCYFQGIGVSKDPEKAEHWLLKSAQNGDADGRFTLGGFYFMKPDIVKALYWLEMAAEQGHTDAIAMLGSVKSLM
jgi:hypothetical protein